MGKKLRTLLAFSTILFAPVDVTQAQAYTIAQGRSMSYCHRFAEDYANRHARGGPLEGAARGAAGGAIIGAVVDGGRGAGTGAGIGALVGGTARGARQNADRDHLYRIAFDDCMRGVHRW
ncbi:MAG: hypothetical protein DSM107014_02225 [Gomphosphaeria aponina SAG 52.96 = DSM 107014]|uniref:Glycine zipper domain-containing protein n=1 Tax=Gomphosphaeria aponina SAG 52.96 = DSM 107014 TaxID=1521640 RepID=A0A941GMX5_9CHRO|nr:hypothetical protein [Gomphosphaeria aponina SAG 52.96 = DSM 107014]